MRFARILCLFLAMTVQLTRSAPPRRQMAGPLVAMDYMHGALMHGDATGGDDHKHEDSAKRQQEELEASLKNKEPEGPQPDDYMHELMHGDGDHQVPHMSHDKAGPEQPAKQAGPGEGMDFLHGVMMHGDDRPGRSHNDDHRNWLKKEAGTEKEKDGPQVGMDYLHGVLMHGDSHTGSDHSAEHAHDKEKLLEKSGHRKFSAPDLESAMHGDDTHEGEDHVHDPNKKPAIPEKHKGIPSVNDPNEAIQGHMDGLIKTETKRKNKNDEDYYEWLRIQRKKNRADNKYEGYSFSSISDQIFDNIETLKRRYLPKFWTGNDDATHRKSGEETVAPSRGAEQKIEEAAEEVVHELLSDLDMIGDTGPRKTHEHHHGGHSGHSGHSGSGQREGSGVKHDEG